MAHFAEIDQNNIVIRVLVVNNNELIVDGVESEQKGIDFLKSLFGGEWVQTSYNSNFRKNYAGIGDFYDISRDAFIRQKPYPSWVLNETTCRWDPPIPCPQDGNQYKWNEELQQWQL